GRSQFGQRIRYDRHAFGVPNPFTGPIRIRPFLAERLLALVVLYNEGPICILMLDALDDEGERAIRGVILILGSNDALCKLGHALGWRLAGQSLDRMREIRVVQKSDEGDHVAARATPAAIEDLFLCIDAKTVVTAAFGTWAAALSLVSPVAVSIRE